MKRRSAWVLSALCAASEPLPYVTTNATGYDIVTPRGLAVLESPAIAQFESVAVSVKYDDDLKMLNVKFSLDPAGADIEARCSVVHAQPNAPDLTYEDVFNRPRASTSWLYLLHDYCSNDALATKTWIHSRDTQHCKRTGEKLECLWTMTPEPTWNRYHKIECAARSGDGAKVVMASKVAFGDVPARGFKSWSTALAGPKVGAASLVFTLEQAENVTCYFHPVPDPIGVNTSYANVSMSVVPSSTSLTITADMFDTPRWSTTFQWPDDPQETGVPAIVNLSPTKRAYMQCITGSSKAVLMGMVSFADYQPGSCACGCHDTSNEILEHTTARCSCASNCKEEQTCCRDYHQYCPISTNIPYKFLSCEGRLHRMEYKVDPPPDTMFRPCSCQVKQGNTTGYHCRDYTAQLKLEKSFGARINLLQRFIDQAPYGLCTAEEAKQYCQYRVLTSSASRERPSCTCNQTGLLLFLRKDCSGARAFVTSAGDLTSDTAFSVDTTKCRPRLDTASYMKIRESRIDPECHLLSASRFKFDPSFYNYAAPAAVVEDRDVFIRSVREPRICSPKESDAPRVAVVAEVGAITVQLKSSLAQCKVCTTRDCWNVMPLPTQVRGTFSLKVPDAAHAEDVHVECAVGNKNVVNETASTPGFHGKVGEDANLSTSNTISLVVNTSNNEGGWCNFWLDGEFHSARFDGAKKLLTYFDTRIKPGMRVTNGTCLTESGAGSTIPDFVAPLLLGIYGDLPQDVQKMVRAACKKAKNISCECTKLQTSVVRVDCKDGSMEKAKEVVPVVLKEEIAGANFGPLTTTTTIAPVTASPRHPTHLEVIFRTKKIRNKTTFKSLVDDACPKRYTCSSTEKEDVEDDEVVFVVVATEEGPESDTETTLTDIAVKDEYVKNLEVAMKGNSEMKGVTVEVTVIDHSNVDSNDNSNLIYGLSAAVLSCCLIVGLITFVRKRAQNRNRGQPIRTTTSFTKWFDESNKSSNDIECGVIPDEPRQRSVKMWNEGEDLSMMCVAQSAEHPSTGRGSHRLARSSGRIWLDGGCPADVENTDTVLAKVKKYEFDDCESTAPRLQRVTSDKPDFDNLYEDPNDWFFFDEEQNTEVGPFSLEQMHMWFHWGLIGSQVKVRKGITEDHPMHRFATISQWYPGKDRKSVFLKEPHGVPANHDSIRNLQKGLLGDSSDGWFYKNKFGREVGPLSKKRIEQLLDWKQILPTTPVHQNGEGTYGTRHAQEVIDDVSVGSGPHVMWEYADKNDIEGFFNTREMRTRYRDGRLNGTSLIKNGLMENWAPLQSVFPGLQDVFEQSDEAYEQAHATRHADSSYRGMDYDKESRLARSPARKLRPVVPTTQGPTQAHTEPAKKEKRTSKVSAGSGVHEARLDVGESLADWFFFDESNRMEVGPFSLDQMRQYFDNKKRLGKTDVSQAKVRLGGKHACFAPVCDWYPGSAPFLSAPPLAPSTLLPTHVESANKASANADMWFYMDADRACEVGPFKKSELDLWLETKQITGDTAVRQIRSAGSVSVKEAMGSDDARGGQRSASTANEGPDQDKFDMMAGHPMDVGESANDWYYFDEDHHVEVGPFSLEQMQMCFATKKALGTEFKPTTKVRHGGDPNSFAPISDWYPETLPFKGGPEAFPPLTPAETVQATSGTEGSATKQTLHGPQLWYYKDGQTGRTVGPLSESQMKCWGEIDEISPSTAVWDQNGIERSLVFKDAFYKNGNAKDWKWRFVSAKTNEATEKWASTMEMLEHLRSGMVTKESMVNNELMDAWAPLQEVFPVIEEAFDPYVTRRINYAQFQHGDDTRRDLTAERRREQAGRRQAVLASIEEKYHIKPSEFVHKPTLSETASTTTRAHPYSASGNDSIYDSDSTSALRGGRPHERSSASTNSSHDAWWHGKTSRPTARSDLLRGSKSRIEEERPNESRLPPSDGRSHSRLRTLEGRTPVIRTHTPNQLRPEERSSSRMRPHSPFQQRVEIRESHVAEDGRSQSKPKQRDLRSSSRMGTRSPHRSEKGESRPAYTRPESRNRQRSRQEDGSVNLSVADGTPRLAHTRSDSRLRVDEMRTPSTMRTRIAEGEHTAGASKGVDTRSASRARARKHGSAYSPVRTRGTGPQEVRSDSKLRASQSRQHGA